MRLSSLMEEDVIGLSVFTGFDQFSGKILGFALNICEFCFRSFSRFSYFERNMEKAKQKTGIWRAFVSSSILGVLDITNFRFSS